MRITMAMLVVAALGAETAEAQSLGTFRWQLQPYCNVLTVTVTQAGGSYRVEGTDDQCGSGRDVASVIGTAFPNPDGSIGVGVTIVTAPGGAPVHVDAELAIASLSGTWRSSAGDTGAFTFTPGAAAPGSPRPRPTAAVPSAIALRPDGSVVATANGSGPIPATGPGSRLMWYAGKAAFRAGTSAGNEWDDAVVGVNSVAAGFRAFASGDGSVALGSVAIAAGPAAVALGDRVTSYGAASFAAGRLSEATGDFSTALGEETHATARASTAIGAQNRASGAYTFAGGRGALASGISSFAFGQSARALGIGSVALGTNAVAQGNGSFVFTDTSPGEFYATPNQFLVRAAGGVGIYTAAFGASGVTMGPGASQWAGVSDAARKHAFREPDGEDLLARLARMPVTEWSYLAQDETIRHIGPTAQDFHAAFGLGEDPLRIGTMDADGVALAAVRALEARTQALRDENRALRAALEDLERRLASVLAPR